MVGPEEKRGPRNFDPVVLGHRECDAWVAYYRHEWGRFLRASLGMVHAGFGMSWPTTVRGAWWVLRANQQWAPYPDNDPDAARESMRRFYALVLADGGLDLDPVEAARREVDWWRIHRIHQREEGLTEVDLVESLCNLYCYVYSTSADAVRDAAEKRVVAMRHSDLWVEAGCDLADPLLAAERRELVASYSSLLTAVS